MPVPERVRIPCRQPVRQPLRGAEIWDRSEADRRDGSNWLDAKVNLNDEALILLNDPGADCWEAETVVNSSPCGD